MTNNQTIIDAIYSHLNEKCQEHLLGYDGQIDYTSDASCAWVSDVVDIDAESAYIEICGRHSRSGRPIVIDFKIINSDDLVAAIENDHLTIPSPVYSL